MEQISELEVANHALLDENAALTAQVPVLLSVREWFSAWVSG